MTKDENNYIELKKYGHTAMESEAYAKPLPWQAATSPNGLPLSLHIAGMIMRGIFPRFPA